MIYPKETALERNEPELKSTSLPGQFERKANSLVSSRVLSFPPAGTKTPAEAFVSPSGWRYLLVIAGQLLVVGLRRLLQPLVFRRLPHGNALASRRSQPRAACPQSPPTAGPISLMAGSAAGSSGGGRGTIFCASSTAPQPITHVLLQMLRARGGRGGDKAGRLRFRCPATSCWNCSSPLRLPRSSPLCPHPRGHFSLPAFAGSAPLSAASVSSRRPGEHRKPFPFTW